MLWGEAVASRPSSVWIARLIALTGIAFAAAAGLAVPPAQAATNTVVSLTFDGHASQYATLNMLQSKGMVGTYFINSAMVGTSS
jgi:hypothetical protein